MNTEEKQKELELQEKELSLKEREQNLELDQAEIKLQKAQELRLSLAAIYLVEDGEIPIYSALFEKTEFDIILKKYYDILQSL